MSVDSINPHKKIAVVSSFKSQGRCTNWRGWVQAFDSYFDEWVSYDICEMTIPDITEAIIKTAPDFLFVFLCDGLRCDMRRIKEGGTKIVYIFGDWVLDDRIPIAESVRYFDYMFLSNKDQIPTYKKLYGINSVHFLPTACYKYDGMFPYNGKYQGDITFVGLLDERENPLNIYKERMLIWDAVRKEYGARAKAYNTPAYPERNDTYDMLPEIYNSSQYVLSISAVQEGMKSYTSARLWSILNLCGLALVHRFDGMEEFGLEDMYNCVAFGNFEELRDKVAVLDSDYDKRMEIKMAGYVLGVKKHTGIERLKEVVRVINDLA